MELILFFPPNLALNFNPLKNSRIILTILSDTSNWLIMIHSLSLFAETYGALMVYLRGVSRVIGPSELKNIDDKALQIYNTFLLDGIFIQ